MRVLSADITKSDEEIICEYGIQSDNNKKETLWFSLDSAYSDLISERSDAALLALLIPAMNNGNEIVIEGCVSERLYYAISGPYQEALKTIIPELNLVEIQAENIQPAEKSNSGVAMGFSAGIDSYSALKQHYRTDLPGFRLTHLLFNNVGSHGSGGEELFVDRYERLRPTVENEIGLPFIAINSNMDSFYEEFLFKRTHTPRNTAIALLLQGGLHRFYYGSAYQYQDIFMGPTDAIAHSDPVMLPLCSTGTVDILPVGSEYSRIEKTLQVTDVPESYQSLNVCTDPEEAGNCSKCYKCLRTLLTLEMTGKMSLYSDVFDFNTYDRNRRSYLLKVSEGGDPYRKELQEFAKETEYYIPLYIRAMSKLKLYTTYEYIKTYVSNRPVLASVAKKVLSYRTQL